MKRDYYNELNNEFLFSMYDSMKVQKNNIVRNHHHTDFEIGFIIRGNGTYILGKKSFAVEPNDIILVRTNELHCIPTITSKELVAFTIHISSYYLLNLCSDYIEKDKIQSLINSEISINNVFHTNNKMILQINELCNIFHENAENNRFLIRAKMLELIIAISDNITIKKSEKTNKIITNSNIKNIQKAINFIKCNYKNQISLADISRATSMSQSYICSIFKLVTGVSPYEYIIAKRLERAVDLILNSDLTILQISMECGFNSITSFNKAFKKKMNVTPNCLRK